MSKEFKGSDQGRRGGLDPDWEPYLPARRAAERPVRRLEDAAVVIAHAAEPPGSDAYR
jgi:hypothetical protein